jgi:hypothetical protein
VKNIRQQFIIHIQAGTSSLAATVVGLFSATYPVAYHNEDVGGDPNKMDTNAVCYTTWRRSQARLTILNAVKNCVQPWKIPVTSGSADCSLYILGMGLTHTTLLIKSFLVYNTASRRTKKTRG